MRIRRLYFTNVRNHNSTELEAANGVNIITGLNGQGKTTILEAIALCTLTRSFVGTKDAYLLQRGAKQFQAKIIGKSDYDVSRKIEVEYNRETGKSIRLDGSPAENAAQVIGAAPTVVLSPDLKTITSGAPSERRRFLDIVLSQAKRRYLEDLIEYRRILRQRNAIFKTALKSKRPVDQSLIEPWDSGLIERSAHLMHERANFIKEFEPILRKTAAEVATGADEVDIRYQPDGVGGEIPGSVAEFRDMLWLRSKEVFHSEQQRGMTLFGAHRDDFMMTVNGGDVRVSASQGQHKTLLIGLKIAEFHYLAKQCAETPIILLDDIFGELDANRAEKVYELTKDLAQVFITVVSMNLLPFLDERSLEPDEAQFAVEGGELVSRDYGTEAEPRDESDDRQQSDID